VLAFKPCTRAARVHAFLHTRPNLFSSIFDNGQLHLAEISSDLGVLYSGRYAFGGCAWFCMKPSVNAARRPFGHGASLRVCLFVVGCRRLVPGLYAGPNVRILVYIFTMANVLILSLTNQIPLSLSPFGSSTRPFEMLSKVSRHACTRCVH
jgi:hypothetical protein